MSERASKGVLGFLAYTRKIITAGPLVKEVIYPRIDRKDSDNVRAAKKKASTAAQARMNAKYSREKCEMKMAANFVVGDPVITLTYDDAHLPQKRTQVKRHMEQFIKEAGKLMPKKSRVPFKLLYVIQNKSSEGRWHVHLICNAPCDYEALRGCWRRGNAEIKPFRFDKEKNYETLARYMCREAREKPGLRLWSCTRSCVNPEVETMAVPNDTQLGLPRGAEMIEQIKERTEYGRYEYIKYSFKAGVRRKHFRRRRRANK